MVTLPDVLLILNVGGTEIVLVVVLFVLLFGVDRIPEVARTLGRVRGQWARVQKELRDEMRTVDEKEAAALRDFERRREKQVRESDPLVIEERRLREAARALGIEGSDTMDVPRLKREIAARAGGGAGDAPP